MLSPTHTSPSVCSSPKRVYKFTMPQFCSAEEQKNEKCDHRVGQIVSNYVQGILWANIIRLEVWNSKLRSQGPHVQTFQGPDVFTCSDIRELKHARF